MKIKLILTTLFFLSFITTFCQSTLLSKAIQKDMPAVFVIKTYDSDGSPLGLGTGFFIDSTGTGITNYHVLAGAKQAEIFLQDDRNYKISYTDGEDKDHDIIRFHIAKFNNNKPKFKYLKISNKLPQIGEDVFTIGNPDGLSFTASNGIVSSVRDDEEMGLIIQTTAPISKGSSGSPLLNIKGEVIGIITFNLKEGQNLNFAFSSKYIKELTKASVKSTLPDDLNSDNNAPKCPKTVTDIDGNGYNTLPIGTQCWMQQNLKTTMYNDGTAIPLVTDNKALHTPAYYWYDNDAATYKNTYGALYNWYTVNTGKLCPSGWHIPSDEEWTTVTDYLGGVGVAGGKMKEAGTFHWQSPNEGANNSSGFTALPGGFASFSSFGSYIVANYNGYWWSAMEDDTTSAWDRYLSNNTATVERGRANKACGFSVRCVKD
jgi:uncharacterized protein (TIGR02145 family)